jgi:hypothetical protein
MNSALEENRRFVKIIPSFATSLATVAENSFAAKMKMEMLTNTTALPAW